MKPSKYTLSFAVKSAVLKLEVEVPGGATDPDVWVTNPDTLAERAGVALAEALGAEFLYATEHE